MCFEHWTGGVVRVVEGGWGKFSTYGEGNLSRNLSAPRPILLHSQIYTFTFTHVSFSHLNIPKPYIISATKVILFFYDLFHLNFPKWVRTLWVRASQRKTLSSGLLGNLTIYDFHLVVITAHVTFLAELPSSNTCCTAIHRRPLAKNCFLRSPPPPSHVIS